MEKKKGFGQRLESFFAGKGFYIVLFLCVAVIGVSAFIMLSGTGTDVDEPNIAGMGQENNYVAPVVTIKPGRIDEEGAGQIKPPVEEPDDSISEPEPPEVVPDESIAAPIPTEDSAETASWVEERVIREAGSTYIWPLIGEIETPYAVTSLVYNRTMADWRTHAGIDLGAELGTPVMVVSGGRVESIYTDDLYGVTVVIDHMGGVRSVYSNLAETPTVYVGSDIMGGEIIGAVGNTALAEAGETTHLHFSMTLDGQSVDPHEYLPG